MKERWNCPECRHAGCGGARKAAGILVAIILFLGGVAPGSAGADGPDTAGSGKAEATGRLPPRLHCLPPDAVVAVDFPRMGSLIDALLTSGLTEKIASHPLYRKQSQNPEFRKVQGLVSLLEAQLDTDWRTGLRRLLSGGLSLSISPDGSILILLDAADRPILDRLQRAVYGLAQAEAARQQQPDSVASGEHRGITTWAFGPEEAHALVGSRLILSNRMDALQAGLDRMLEKGDDHLAGSPGFRACSAAIGGKTALMVFVDLETLHRQPGFQEALSGSGGNPLAALLFAGVAESLQASSWLGLAARSESKGLVVETRLDGKPEAGRGAASFAMPGGATGGALPNLEVPRRIAALSLYRDLHGFYAAKDTLFPERTSGLIFFENMMGIFFSGLDLTEEVFAETRPRIRLVVAEQEFDPEVGTPYNPLPGFALVVPLRHPEEFAEVVEEAWQKALGLVNFTRGQKALPGLVIDRPTHEGIQFSVAYFRPPEDPGEEAVDNRYNFRPALARVKQHLILSSTEGLARDLLDALRKETTEGAEPLDATHSLLELDGSGLHSILASNRENLIRQNMVEKGNSREEAEVGIDLLLALVDCLDAAGLRVGTQGGLSTARLEVQLKLPKALQSTGSPQKVSRSDRGASR